MKLLITGASGLLGANLSLAALDAGVDLATSSLERRLLGEGLNWHPADLTKPDQVLELVELAAPDWIINCAAATNVDRCEREPDWAMALNRDAPRNLAQAAAQFGCRLIHISTDAVFDGERNHYTERDQPQPVNVYGASKLAGEREVLKVDASALVVRTNFYGWGPPGRPSLAEWFLDHLQAGQQCPGFADVRFCPLLVNQLARLLLRLTEQALQGPRHVVASDCLTKYEFGVRIARAFELEADLIVPTSVAEVGLQAKRPRNLVLEPGDLEQQLGLELPTVQDGIEEFQRLKQVGHRERLEAMVADRVAARDLK